MLSLNRQSLQHQKEAFRAAGIEVPSFDYETLIKRTADEPVWIHFGAGNLFRGFHALIQQRLIEKNKSDRGIIVAETFDYEIIEKVYRPYDNLGLQVIMCGDGTLQKTLVASVTESIAADRADEREWARLAEIFKKPSLQMVTISITEKGYDLKDADGVLRQAVTDEIAAGPTHAAHAMAKLTALLFERYKAGAPALALVSTDNFSHNGDRLMQAVMTVAGGYREHGFVDEGFLSYLNDKSKIAFPWSMIDKITPYPSPRVKAELEKSGFSSTEIIKTAKNSVAAPFVNTEESEYLVVEDMFPNGRPPLQEAGVFMTSRETVDKVEKMKVCTCLNPLHTTLAVLGCLLGYDSIADEMKDDDLRTLVSKIGYDEGMPVVVNPGIIEPRKFLKEVLEVRLPNPNIPDTPQRIATDTSQKLGIRFGETIKLYEADNALDTATLVYIPLVIAAWCRYLLGYDDKGAAMTLSPDPLLPYLQEKLKDVKLGNSESGTGRLKDILSNETIFGINLYQAGLGDKIESYFKEMLTGAGAVRAALQKYL
jgi:fructuronate reductase